MEQVLQSIQHILDTSNYPITHPLYSNERAKQLGFWKDETGGQSKIESVVALRSKVYSMKMAPTPYGTSSSDVLKCKGVKSVGLSHLTFEDYKKALEELVKTYASFNIIRHKDFQLFQSMVRKVALSAFDDKRCMYPCNLHTYAYGSIEPEVFAGQCRFCNKVSMDTAQQLLRLHLSNL